MIEPFIEVVVEKVITRKLNNVHEDPFDIDQAALFLKKAKQTIYGYCSKKTIPHHYSGGAKLIFFKTELVEWLKAKYFFLKKNNTRNCHNATN